MPFPFMANLILPVIAGVIGLIIVKYIRYLIPMRVLIAGRVTYNALLWGLVLFTIYMLSRPLQVLLGPYPGPLVICNLREYLFSAIFVPTLFIGSLSFSFGYKSITKKIFILVYGLGFFVSTVFSFVNLFSMDGYQILFQIGKYGVYDGNWYAKLSTWPPTLIYVLIGIRFISPVGFMLMGGIISAYRGLTYPSTTLYNNMPRKLFLISLACFAFAIGLLFAGFLAETLGLTHYWWMFYLGLFSGGLCELISLRLPLRKTIRG